jgi:hypothetical protein
MELTLALDAGPTPASVAAADAKAPGTDPNDATAVAFASLLAALVAGAARMPDPTVPAGPEAAVAGLSCMSPRAPALLTARGSRPDSARATEARRAGDTPYLAPACWKSWSKLVPVDDAPSDGAAADVPSTRRMAVGVDVMSCTFTTSPRWGATTIFPSPA